MSNPWHATLWLNRDGGDLTNRRPRGVVKAYSRISDNQRRVRPHTHVASSRVWLDGGHKREGGSSGFRWNMSGIRLTGGISLRMIFSPRWYIELIFKSYNVGPQHIFRETFILKKYKNTMLSTNNSLLAYVYFGAIKNTTTIFKGFT